jgi:hypothetical protein
MKEMPTRQEKLDACARYNTPEYKRARWNWKAPVPPVPTIEWTAGSWVKWIDAHGSWVRREDSSK